MTRNPNWKKTPPPGAVYLSSTQVRARYGGVSQGWLNDKIRNDPNFPRPIQLTEGGRYLFKLDGLEAYERQAVVRSVA